MDDAPFAYERRTAAEAGPRTTLRDCSEGSGKHTLTANKTADVFVGLTRAIRSAGDYTHIRETDACVLVSGRGKRWDYAAG